MDDGIIHSYKYSELVKSLDIYFKAVVSQSVVFREAASAFTETF